MVFETAKENLEAFCVAIEKTKTSETDNDFNQKKQNLCKQIRSIEGYLQEIKHFLSWIDNSDRFDWQAIALIIKDIIKNTDSVLQDVRQQLTPENVFIQLMRLESLLKAPDQKTKLKQLFFPHYKLAFGILIPASLVLGIGVIVINILLGPGVFFPIGMILAMSCLAFLILSIKAIVDQHNIEMIINKYDEVESKLNDISFLAAKMYYSTVPVIPNALAPVVSGNSQQQPKQVNASDTSAKEGTGIQNVQSQSSVPSLFPRAPTLAELAWCDSQLLYPPSLIQRG